MNDNLVISRDPNLWDKKNTNSLIGDWCLPINQNVPNKKSLHVQVNMQNQGIFYFCLELQSLYLGNLLSKGSILDGRACSFGKKRRFCYTLYKENWPTMGL